VEPGAVNASGAEKVIVLHSGPNFVATLELAPERFPIGGPPDPEAAALEASGKLDPAQAAQHREANERQQNELQRAKPKSRQGRRELMAAIAETKAALTSPHPPERHDMLKKAYTDAKEAARAEGLYEGR
jgi:hypothetical protein